MRVQNCHLKIVAKHVKHETDIIEQEIGCTLICTHYDQQKLGMMQVEGAIGNTNAREVVGPSSRAKTRLLALHHEVWCCQTMINY